MPRQGRNDRCSCGSGLKFKRCCGSSGKIVKNSNGNLKPEPKPFGLPVEVPEDLLLQDVHDPGLATVVDNAIAAFSDLATAAGWEHERLESLQKVLRKTAFTKSPQFPVIIMDEVKLIDAFKSGQVSASDINRVYWNEIDQYAFNFRNEVFNLICQSTRSSLVNFEDHVALAALGRQVIEATMFAVANQFILGLCWATLRDEIVQYQTPFTIVKWEELYNFVIRLSAWSPRQRRAMAQFNPSFSAEIAGHVNDDYSPSFTRLFSICRESSRVELISRHAERVTADLDRLKVCYGYLCKFIHVTPQLFRPYLTDRNLKHADVVKSVRLCMLEAFAVSLEVLTVRFLLPRSARTRFLDLVPTAIDASSTPASLTVEDSLLANLRNPYKDVWTEIDGVKVVLHKARAYSVGAEKLAKTYDRASDEDQQRILDLLAEIDAKPHLQSPG